MVFKTQPIWHPPSQVRTKLLLFAGTPIKFTENINYGDPFTYSPTLCPFNMIDLLYILLRGQQLFQ